MNLTLRSCPVLGVLSALALACGPDPGGETATGSTGTTDEPTTTDPTSSTGDEPTTGPTPSGCGDGVVEWIHTEQGQPGEGARALAVAVDATGRIIVAGAESDPEGGEQPMVLVLDPAGAEVWRRTLGGPGLPDMLYDVVVDDGGRIFVAGREEADGGSMAGMIRALSADGDELWGFSEVGADPGFGAEIGGLALGHGALYSAGTEYDTVVVRRHDPATGAAVWKTSHDDDILMVYDPDIAVVGASVVTVARVALGGGEGHPFVLQLDQGGAITSVDVDPQTGGWWLSADAIGADELLVAGEQFIDGGEGVAVRRGGLDGAEAWSTFLVASPQHEELWDAAVAPDQRILLVGATISDNFSKTIPSVRCLAGNGSGQWQAPFAFNDDEYEDDIAYGAAFGPGFMVVVGAQWTTIDTLWVRKYALE